MPGPDFFSDPWWTDETRAAWLASLMDHAGRIVCSTNAVTVTLQSHDAYVLRALQRSFPLGEIESLSPRGPHLWRITQPMQIRRLIGIVSPFLTTTHASASDALRRLDEQAKERQAIAQRDREIVAASLAGRSQVAIARAFGISVNTVAAVVERYQRGPKIDDDPMLEHLQ